MPDPISVKMKLELAPFGVDFSYAPDDPIKSSKNLRRVVAACDTIEAFLDKLFGLAANGGGMPTDALTIEVTPDRSAAPYILPEEAIDGPANAALAEWRITRQAYKAAYNDLVGFLSSNGLRAGGLPDPDDDGDIILRVPGIDDPDLTDSILPRVYVWVGNIWICRVGRTLYLDQLKAQGELKFLSNEAGTMGHVELRAQFDFPIPIQ